MVFLLTCSSHSHSFLLQGRTMDLAQPHSPFDTHSAPGQGQVSSNGGTWENDLYRVPKGGGLGKMELSVKSSQMQTHLLPASCYCYSLDSYPSSLYR